MSQRNIALLLLLTVAVFTGLVVYGDLPRLAQTISSFPAELWLAVLGLAIVNYLLRLVRWLIFLKVLKIDAPANIAIGVFFAGFSMTLSPGRVGELGKSYFLHKKADVPVAVSTSAVITERLADLMSVLVLGVWGFMFVPYGWLVIVIVLAALAGFLVLLSIDGTSLLQRIPVLRKYSHYYVTSREAFRVLFSLRIMSIGVVLGALAWFAEGYAFWIVLKGLGAATPLLMAVSIYAASSLLGAATMLPGGLVGTEGTMLVLLQRSSVGITVASAGTLIIRVCTLWFAVVVGLFALIYIHLASETEARATSVRYSRARASNVDYGAGDGD